MKKRIYMDYASTTPVAPEVLETMMPYFSEKFGNPSSIHAEGVEAKKALEAARRRVARIIGARPDEIVFTSGGTEANNLALRGVLAAYADSPQYQSKARYGARRGLDADLRRRGSNNFEAEKLHIVTTNIEHSSVLEPIRELARPSFAPRERSFGGVRRGVSVTYVPVESNGIVHPEKIAEALRPETALVSVGYANNEIGTVQPVAKIAKKIKDFRFKIKDLKSGKDKVNRMVHATGNLNLTTVKNRPPIFHTDASQAALYLDCNAERLGVDLMTIDGHKMYGPKGVGVLYVRRGTPLAPFLFGGGQERGLRPATENVPLAVGMAKAFEMAAALREKESERLAKLRDYFYSNVLKNIRIRNPGIKVVLNGDQKDRLPNNVNISILGLDTEFAALRLNATLIACSTKSSCLEQGAPPSLRESGASEGRSGSYVVQALGGGEERANSTLRFTFGRDTAKEDIDYLILQLARVAVGHSKG